MNYVFRGSSIWCYIIVIHIRICDSQSVYFFFFVLSFILFFFLLLLFLFFSSSSFFYFSCSFFLLFFSLLCFSRFPWCTISCLLYFTFKCSGKIFLFYFIFSITFLLLLKNVKFLFIFLLYIHYIIINNYLIKLNKIYEDLFIRDNIKF